jgi:tetratricopeptide (TPR) repeat protein
MKNIPLLFLAPLLLLIGFNISTERTSYTTPQKIKAIKNRSSYGCAPLLSAINFSDSTTTIPLLDGWGKYRMAVTTKNDSANIYFQQGINMYYGFHIIEALGSFEKATQLDENFAMGYWGKALAYGPNINDIGYAASPEALAAVQKAKALYNNATPVEKALIDAMDVRYSPDSSQKREYLNQLYADAMKKVHTGFPTSADAAALYADALMVQHPWDLYDRHYNPKPWTPEIVAVLEGLVKQFPENPGASHYYIHAIEGSREPQKGLAVADRLGAMMPGLAHLVHMPSHIYIRSGHYGKGAEVNEEAVKGYYNYLSKYPLTVNNSFLYLAHNQHMRAACAAMDGQYSKAMKYSYDTQNSVDSTWIDGGGFFGVYAQYMYMMPYFTHLRFGKWADILRAPPIPDSRVYANIMWSFARGIANAREHQFEDAGKELQRIQNNKSNPQLKESPTAFNPGIVAVEVAENILQGVIAEEKNQLSHSITFLKDAVAIEDEMLYGEPRDWLLPSRQYLGAALLKAKQYAEAEKVYKEDLMINPNNAWSLTGLEKSLAKQNKKNEARAIQDQIKKASARADIKIISSVF